MKEAWVREGGRTPAKDSLTFRWVRVEGRKKSCETSAMHRWVMVGMGEKEGGGRREEEERERGEGEGERGAGGRKGERTDVMERGSEGGKEGIREGEGATVLERRLEDEREGESTRPWERERPPEELREMLEIEDRGKEGMRPGGGGGERGTVEVRALGRAGGREGTTVTWVAEAGM